MPRTTASPADECATSAANAVIEFIEQKLGCDLKREWSADLEDMIGGCLNDPIDEALDEAYDEGHSEGHDEGVEEGRAEAEAESES